MSKRFQGYPHPWLEMLVLILALGINAAAIGFVAATASPASPTAVPPQRPTLDRGQLLEGFDTQLQAAIDYPTGQAGQSCSTGQPSGCTVFTVAKGDQVFFGGNDDYINPDSWYWVDPGEGENYGAIWIGTPDNVQQGVNEKGLAYDANGLPDFTTNIHLEREPVLGSYTFYPIQILHECATVKEVIDWANTHQWHSYMHDQMLTQQGMR